MCLRCCPDTYLFQPCFCCFPSLSKLWHLAPRLETQEVVLASYTFIMKIFIRHCLRGMHGARSWVRANKLCQPSSHGLYGKCLDPLTSFTKLVIVVATSSSLPLHLWLQPQGTCLLFRVPSPPHIPVLGACSHSPPSPAYLA